MIRVMAWILRFQPKAKDLRKCAELKNEELLNAQKIIFRLIQKECYSNEETRKSLKDKKIKHLEVPFPPLPKDRTEVAAVFQVSGVDLAGPLLTKSKQKTWIVLFTCAVFRAVHLELITSLSTTDFIQAMRRFIARRGRISVMYSDNGTNFTGLNNALRQLDWTTIESEFRVHEKYVGSLIHPLLHGGEASGNA
ncbi:uncharacterized protein TNCV_4898331 [Trichonephila clavipes]|nr:uncharacterized protein TNCV_4898331 [Trichonephila clavipes]